MIEDGICDELTNTADYSWDGGDCCLDIYSKDTSRCKICTCQLTVHEDQLKIAFEQMEVKRFADPGDFLSRIDTLVHVTTNVKSAVVCTTFCLSEELSNNVNGWMFDVILKTCTCGWLETTRCLARLSMIENPQVISDNMHVSVAYIQGVKLPRDCNTLGATLLKTTTTISSSSSITSSNPINNQSLDMNCTEKYNQTASTTGLSTLSGNWITLSSGIEIAVLPGFLSFYEAVQGCLNIGGRLFEPHSPGEMEQVSGPGCDIEMFCETWIGVTDAMSEGEYDLPNVELLFGCYTSFSLQLCLHFRWDSCARRCVLLESFGTK